MYSVGGFSGCTGENIYVYWVESVCQGDKKWDISVDVCVFSYVRL